MKGVSPIISTVILILVAISMAAVVGPWIMNLATESAAGSSETAEQELICRKTAYDFDSDYGNSGAEWNFTGTNGTISTKIMNTGYQNIYNFSFELSMQTPEGEQIVAWPDINVTTESQKTKTSPLKPGSSHIVHGSIANINDTWSLTKVKVLNVVCPKASPTLAL